MAILEQLKDGELGYQAKRTGLSMVASKTAGFVGNFAEASADTVSSILNNTVGAVLRGFLGPELAADIGALAGTFGNRVIGFLGAGLAAGVSAGFAQMDYGHTKEKIKNFYKDEIAAKLHKPAGKLTIADMESVAKDIPAIEEELQRARRQRNFAVPIAALTTLISFAAVTVALPAVLSAMSIPAVTGFAGILLNAAVSMATYFAVKTPLQTIGNKQFDLKKKTATDEIQHIKNGHEKGLAVTPEAVAQVFAHTHCPIQHDAALLQKLADDINNNVISAKELAFIAVGQSSGVERKAPTPKPVPAFAQESGDHFQKKIGRSKKRGGFDLPDLHDVSLTHAEKLDQVPTGDLSLG